MQAKWYIDDDGYVMSSDGNVIASDKMPNDVKNLIASAPELYTTLEDLSIWLIAPDTSDKTLRQKCKIVSAALAKARGLSQ